MQALLKIDYNDFHNINEYVAEALYLKNLQMLEIL